MATYCGSLHKINRTRVTQLGLAHLRRQPESDSMKYFLVAPLAGLTRAETAPRNPANERSGLALRSRVDYQTQELRQTWRPITVPAENDSVEPAIEQAWLVSVGNRSFLALIVLASAPISGSNSAVESVLSDLAFAFAAKTHEISSTPLWVSRTLLLPPGGSVPPGWIDGDATTVSLDRPDGTGAQLHLGWGNNAIIGWDESVRPEQSQLLLGILDAQYLWVDIEALSTQSSDSVHEIVESGQSRGLRRNLLLMEQLSTSLALHNLAYDDLLMHVQGVQRTAAVALLKAWNYSDVTERVARRIEDTTRVLEQKTARRDRVYQGVVEAVLFGLALTAVLDLVVAVISTSLASYSSGIEHPGSPVGILPWFAATDPDYLIIATILGIVVLAATVGLVRLRRR